MVRETPRRLRLCSLILIVPSCCNAPVWDVGWDWPRIDVMETGLFRLVMKRQFATDRFRRRNCIVKHYCDPSGNSFPPNCTPELEAFVRTRSMMFCIKLTICFTFSRRIDFPLPPFLKFSSPLLILMGEGHDFETSGLKGQRNTKAFETALININSSTALNRLSWGVCWDCHRIDAMETGSIRLVQKRPFARVRFRLRNCLGNHYCNPSENTFPPNCTPECQFE